MSNLSFKLPIELDAYHISTYELIQTEQGSNMNSLGRISGLLSRKMPEEINEYPIKASMCQTLHKYRRIPNHYKLDRNLQNVTTLYQQKQIVRDEQPTVQKQLNYVHDKGMQTPYIDEQYQGLQRRACSRAWQGFIVKNDQYDACYDVSFQRKRKGWEL